MNCIHKQPTPCHQYDSMNQDDLNAFLVANGGQQARFDKEGTANIVTLVKGEPRFIYCKPNSWLRCIGTGNFMAHSDGRFQANFQLV